MDKLERFFWFSYLDLEIIENGLKMLKEHEFYDSIIIPMLMEIKDARSDIEDEWRKKCILQ